MRFAYLPYDNGDNGDNGLSLAEIAMVAKNVFDYQTWRSLRLGERNLSVG
jgi:hypothetical protein